ncbi:hypothetical protein HY502_03500 [Candidatus Woesebacteria bacterium]|nr:hypothetical protein [Candidatus Woesebacteria bacterium]
MADTEPLGANSSGGEVNPLKQFRDWVKPPAVGSETKDSLKEKRIADGRARLGKWEERLYLILGTPEHFGRVVQQKQEQFGQKVQSLTDKVTGAVTEAKDSASEGIDSWKNRLIDLKDSVAKRVKDAKEAASVARDNVVEAFFDRVDATKKFAREKADAIDRKAESIKYSAAKKIVRGAEIVVDTTTLVVGAGAAVVMGGVYLGDRAIKWGLRETQAFPREVRAKAREGLSGIAREMGLGLVNYADRKRSEARSDRAKATSVRTRYT